MKSNIIATWASLRFFKGGGEILFQMPIVITVGAKLPLPRDELGLELLEDAAFFLTSRVPNNV